MNKEEMIDRVLYLSSLMEEIDDMVVALSLSGCVKAEIMLMNYRDWLAMEWIDLHNELGPDSPIEKVEEWGEEDD